MSRLPSKFGVTMVVLGLSLAPPLAYGEDRLHFDLVCRGEMQEMNSQSRSTPFTTRIRVNVQKKQFCIDDLCNKLTRSDEKKIEFHCHPGRTFCYEIGSTGGPFVLKDDFAVDRSTGEFQRSYAGEVGDRAPRRFNSKYSGVCRPAPFSGLGRPGIRGIRGQE
jgi:hypothetical protein